MASTKGNNMTKAKYTTKSATEYGNGIGPNGMGRRAKVSGFYVVSPEGRNARAFTGKDAEQKASEWAAYCNENLL